MYLFISIPSTHYITISCKYYKSIRMFLRPLSIAFTVIPGYLYMIVVKLFMNLDDSIIQKTNKTLILYFSVLFFFVLELN